MIRWVIGPSLSPRISLRVSPTHPTLSSIAPHSHYAQTTQTMNMNSIHATTGDIRLPVWGPVTTTESRLVVRNDCGTREYDNTAYEEQMFYFNVHQRVALYK